MQGKYFFIGKDHPSVRQNAYVEIHDFDGRDCLAKHEGQIILLPIQALRKKRGWQDDIHRRRKKYNV